MRILLAVWPDAPRHLLVHCMTHDVGESVSGDPPYPIKALNADLKQACDRIEAAAHELMSATWGLPPAPGLTALEKKIFKMCEFIEMWEWGLHELGLGNQHAFVVAQRCIAQVQERVDELRLGGMINLANRASEYVKRRADCGSWRLETHGLS